MRKTIGKIVIPTLVLLLLLGTAIVWHFASPVEARRIYGKTEQMIGTYSGVGAGQTHNIKASLDLAHTDLDAMITYDTDVLGLLGVGTGNVIYCDSATSGKTTGVDWTNAVDDLDEAIALCSGDSKYTIMVAPGHTEDVASAGAIEFDVADITVIGLGNGENRPTFTLKTATTATILVEADDITLRNLIFVSDLADVAVCLDVNDGSENCVISDCSFVCDTPGTDEFFTCISVGDAADGITVENCKAYMGTGAAKYFVLFDHDSDYSRIIGNEVFGDYATACIHNDGTDLCNNLLIKDNILYNGQDGIGLNAQPVIELKSTDTGVIANNICVCDVATPEDAIVAADCHLFNNRYSENESTAGSVPIGLQNGAIGSQLVIVVDVNSSLIPNNTQTAGAITGAADGILVLEDICISTDATGFAGPTNIEISTDNVYGATGAGAPLMLEAVAGLGANISWVIGDATTSELPTQIESGKKLYIHGDNGAGTGDKHQKITLFFRRVTAGATIAANDGPS